MSGYEWWPIVKVEREDRQTVTYDLRSDLTFIDGPTRVTGPNYTPVFSRMETITRRVRDRVLGFRASVELEFAVGDDMVDHDILAAIVSACAEDKATVRLSLDGGVTYRAVRLTRYDGPDPIAGKTFAGAMFRLGFQCEDLIDEIPSVASATW